jgi:phosphoribosyl-ATP pyrophosphohydrolase/phosphoribosyl-AMP cyclohydrolase
MSPSFRIASVEDLDRLDFTRGNGLLTVVTQDVQSRRVLMVAHADREALELTVRSGDMHYRSRTRGLWRKGETSGNVQRVRSLLADCDADTVLALVEPAGPACHTGAVSCFACTDTLVIPSEARDLHFSLATLDATIAGHSSSESNGGRSYTRRLLEDRNLRLKKVGEESVELVVACTEGDRARVTSEAADLLYHMLVAVRAAGVSLSDVEQELARRHKPNV